jgi:hypothetical protein
MMHDDTPPLFATLPVRLAGVLGALFLLGALAAGPGAWVIGLFAAQQSGAPATEAPPQQQTAPAGQGPTAR